jgi:hypothetical protein
MLKKWLSAITGGKHSKINKPVFVVGCGRSGTTLLFDLLSQHPQLARTTGYPDGEDHEGWIKFGKCVMAGIGNVNSDKYGSGINGYHACLHMTAEDVTPEIVEGMHRYYWNDVLKNDKAKRVINKCPHNSNKLDYMLGIFPDAKIVHIVRDCEPMVASWIAVMNDHPALVLYWPEEDFPCFSLLPKPDSPTALKCLARHERFFPGGGAALFIDYWRKTNMGIEKQMQGRLNQLLVVRYEDLVAKPDHVLSGIAKFCELSPYEFAVANMDPNTASKHKHLLPEGLEEIIGIQAETVRQYFGYLTTERATEKRAETNTRVLRQE